MVNNFSRSPRCLKINKGVTRRNHIWQNLLEMQDGMTDFLCGMCWFEYTNKNIWMPIFKKQFQKFTRHKVRCCEEILVANLATNFKDLLGSTINLETLTVVLGAVSCPASLKRKKEGANNYLVSITNNFITHHRVWTWLRWPSRSLLLRYWRLTCRAANMYITHLLHHLWINAHTILFH